MLISLRNLEKSYPPGPARTCMLRRITLDIAAGEFVSIMGPSGAGKSTLLHILGMHDAGWTGEFDFLGRGGAAVTGPHLLHLRIQHIHGVAAERHDGRVHRPCLALLLKSLRGAGHDAAGLGQGFGLFLGSGQSDGFQREELDAVECGEALTRVGCSPDEQLAQLHEPSLAEPGEVDHPGQGVQCLRGADVVGGLLPANVLLARLEGEDEAPAAVHVGRLAGDPARHAANVFLGRAEEPEGGTAVVLY